MTRDEGLCTNDNVQTTSNEYQESSSQISILLVIFEREIF